MTDVGKGDTQMTTSDAQGRYRVPALPVGEYEVQSGKEGFQTFVHKGITLTVGKTIGGGFLPGGRTGDADRYRRGRGYASRDYLRSDLESS